MQYRKCVVSYIDLLGFRRLIENSEVNPDGVDRINTVLNAFATKGDSNWDIDTAHGHEPIATIRKFSDLILRVTPLRPQLGPVELLSLEAQTLAKIQWELLALHQTLLRGGVCFKPMYYERGNEMGQFNIFGPGMVLAYQLAKKQAVYPRIIVDNQFAQSASRINVPQLRHYLQRGEDGQCFIDYLNGHLHSFAVDIVGTMKTHKNFVTEKLNEYKDERDKGIRQKYVWMAFYHNNTLKTAIDEFDFSDLRECEIDTQDLW